jgi:hypothetical protein
LNLSKQISQASEQNETIAQGRSYTLKFMELITEAQQRETVVQG